MRVPALTLASRSLSVGMRSRTGFVMRAGLVGLMIAALMASLNASPGFGAPGLFFFQWLIYTNFYVLTLIGIAVFSGVITEEKETMTLGLLRLAGFGAVSIILGKSTALLCSTVLLVALQLPFAVLAITMGGVSQHQILAAYCMLGAHLFAVFGISLVCSVVFKSSTAAARVAAILVFGWILGPGLLAAILDEISGGMTGSSTWLRSLGSLNAASGIEMTTYTGYDEPLWNPVVWVNLAIGAAGFALGWMLFRSSNRDERPAAQTRPQLLLRRGRGSRPSHLAACLWKDYRFLGNGPAGLIVRSCIYVVLFILVGVLTGGSRRMGSSWFSIWMMQASAIGFTLECLYLSARCFQQEVKWNTLQSLVALPVTTRSWAYTKVAGCAVQLIPATCAVAISMSLVLTDMHGVGEFLSVMFYYFANVLVACHVAAWLGLRLKRGAFALAIVSLVFQHICFFMVCPAGGVGPDEGSLFVWGIVLAFLSLGMQVAIGGQIEKVAAEA